MTEDPGLRLKLQGWLAVSVRGGVCCAAMNLALPAFAEPSLVFLDSVRIADKSAGFNEPSGLALASDGQSYWSVSDDTGKVFALTPEGKLMPDLALPVGDKDLEGIASDPLGNRLVMVREDKAEIVTLDMGDGSVARHKLTGMQGFDRISPLFGKVGSNNGLEGIAINPDNGSFLLVKEANPRLLVEVSADLSRIVGATELSADAGFACSPQKDATLDVSDITYDRLRQVFWILSDSGSCVVVFDPATGSMQSLPLPTSADGSQKPLKNAEGIALDAAGDELRIVTDDGKDSRLLTLSIQ